MSLFRWLLLGAIVVSLVVGGVLEIKVHPEELSKSPGRILRVAGDGAVREQVRGTVVSWKRTGEQWIIGDDAKKFQLAISYIESDADRLLELAETGKDSAESFLPQAELLVSSIERSGKLTDSVSVDVLASARDKTKAALRSAANALAQLKDLKEELYVLNERFAAVTDQLESQVGEIHFADEPSQEGAVAGAQDGEVADESSRSKDIPLTF